MISNKGIEQLKECLSLCSESISTLSLAIKANNVRISALERKVDAIVKFCMESAEGPHSARNRLEEELNDTAEDS